MTVVKRSPAQLTTFIIDHQYWLLGGIILIALSLRLYHLGAWSFWGDEMYTIQDADNFFQTGFTKRKLSYFVIRYILDYFGTNEWSARIFPALIGVVTIPALYFSVRKLFGTGVALIFALLLALSHWHLYWSQNARFYTPLLLFYTLALLTFYLAFEEDRLSYLFISMVWLGAATLEHLTALFFVPIALAYLLLIPLLGFEKPVGYRPRNIGIFVLPGMIAAVFLVGPILQQPARWLNYFGYVNNSPLWILAGVVYYIGPPVVCLAAFGVVYMLTQKDRATLFLSLGALIPLVALMLIALVQYSANRYVFLSLASWIILASVAVKELFSNSRGGAKIFALGVLSFLILAPINENLFYFKYQNGNRENSRAAFALIKALKEEQDVVVVPHLLLSEYYLQENVARMSRVKLDKVENRGHRIWLVEDMTVAEKYPAVYAWMTANSRLIANMDVHVNARNFKMRVYLYEPAPSKNKLAFK